MRKSLIALGAAVAAAALPAPALAQDGGTAEAANSRVTVQLDIEKFRSTQNGPQAVGTARARLRGLAGGPTTVVEERVRLAVQRRGRCQILRLVLNELDLTLLGVNVHLDRVVLRVTGQRRGGILGRLFCSLANTRIGGASQAKAVRALNSRLRKGGELRPLKMTVPVQAMAAQAGTCQILDLVLGPLDLNLLGLVVELNRVHLTITADPNGGILGSLLCGVANTPLPTP